MRDHSLKSRRFVILNLFQDNRQRWCVILKQVQDDEILGSTRKNFQHAQHIFLQNWRAALGHRKRDGRRGSAGAGFRLMAFMD